MYKLTYVLFPLIYFQQLNAQNFEWAFAAGGTGIETGYSISTDPSGSVYVTGVFAGEADFDPSGASSGHSSVSGSSDIIIAKYDAEGEYVWAFSLGDASPDIGYDITTDDDGNFYITGMFSGSVDFNPLGATAETLTAVSEDVYFAKYNSDGILLWAYQIGGAISERGKAIFVDDAGNVYITGYFRGTCDFDPSAGTQTLTSSGGSPDIFFAKYSESGSYIWAKSLSGVDGDSGNDIIVNSMGEVYLTGYFQDEIDFDPSDAGTELLTASFSLDIFLAKYNASGEYIWAISFDAPAGGGVDEGKALAFDSEENIYVTGYFTATVDFDPSAETAEFSAGTSEDGFLAKYDSDGNYLWAFDIGGSTSDFANAIATDDDGNVFVCGSFMGITDFDPSADVVNLTSASGLDIFFAKYSAEGEFVWASAMSGAETQEATGITNDASGNIYITGTFLSTADFDAGTETFEITASGEEDIFVAKYADEAVFPIVQLESPSVHIKPNPVIERLEISSEYVINAIIITDITGSKLLYQHNLNLKSTVISLSHLPKGMYCLQLQFTEGSIHDMQFLKQ